MSSVIAVARVISFMLLSGIEYLAKMSVSEGDTGAARIYYSRFGTCGNEVPLYSEDLLNSSVLFVNTVLMGTQVIVEIMAAVLTIHALLLLITKLVKGNMSQ